MTSLSEVTWPPSRMGEAVQLLAARAGLRPTDAVSTAPSEAVLSGPETGLESWLGTLCEQLGFESESVATTYAEVGHALEASAPALWRFPSLSGFPEGCVAVLGGKRGTLRVLDPEGALRRVPTELVARVLRGPLDAIAQARVHGMLDAIGSVGTVRQRARAVILEQHVGREAVEGGYVLRPSPGSSFVRQMRRERLPAVVARMLLAHTAQYLLMLAAWAVLGRGALEGRYDAGWFAAWLLLLVTALPFRLAAAWAESQLAIRFGRLLKQRLLFGTFRLRPEQIRHEGSGELLGRVIESEAVESLMTSGGLAALMALVEILVVFFVLARGAGGLLHVMLLAFWTALALVVARLYSLRRGAWTRERLSLTRELVERMVGHRTRLAQEAPERWHDGEDAAVERYLHAATRVDGAALTLSALVGRGWLVVGVIGLVPAVLSGNLAPDALAIGLGGVMLADRALQKLTSSFVSLGDAAIALRVVAPLFEAAADKEPAGVPGFAMSADDESASGPVIQSLDLVYRHAGRPEPVLKGCEFTVRAHDKILLEGPSGGGKSTLATLLSGLRPVDSGLLLLHGLDRRTLGGAAWRRRVVCAPQFHENHILTGSFAFNLLMGRGWPAGPGDLAEAERVCTELGLGPLLSRMPGGMMQVVGETGWQLSHGERSRLFIARAILQRADVMVLDESFAALDPENLSRALSCVLARSKTLLVIAHP